ncbi:hypothetical protein R1sor_027194 [Riccia sorocarpa]|uniref:Uncharacterized protein n=1 Tax=Riccia sorocarpa TaxID=122646 RepID=A0ABD3GH74_9MARC
MDTPLTELESEEERIRRDLELLFGPEVSESEVDSSEVLHTEADVEFPPATSIHPEELYCHLERAGVLQLPFTTVESIRVGVQDSLEDDPRFWGTWRTRRVKSIPDHDDSGRIKYKMVVSDIDEGQEVWVSRLWTGDNVPEFLQSLQATNVLVQSVASELVQVRQSVEELKIKILVFEQHFDKEESAVSALRGDVTSLLLSAGSQSDVLKEQQLTLVNLEERLQTDSRKLGRQVKNQLSKLETSLPVVVDKVIKSSPHPGADVSLIEAIETKFRSYADVTRTTHSTALKEHEEEQEARQLRSKNLRISGLEEIEGENTRDKVVDFLSGVMKVTSPVVDQAFHLGKGDRGVRPILVKFTSMEGRNVVLGNKSLLKGLRIWVDPDLTPAQALDKRKELEKVKKANDEGWVAFLRDGKAVITTRQRES